MITVVVAVDPEFETAVVARLTECDDIEVVSRPADEAELIVKAAVGAGTVFVVSRYFPGLDADVVAGLQRHGAHVLALGRAQDFAAWGVPSVDLMADAQTLGAAVRGCAASVQLPPKPDRSPAVPVPDGKLLTVWGAGGAPGRSTVSAALAHIAARSGQTVLVDADTVGASQAVLLGVLDDSPQLAALCRAASAGHLDAATVEAQWCELGPGLRLITGMSRPERWAEIGPGVLAEVLAQLRRQAALSVVDVSWRTDPDDEFADPLTDRHGATRAALDAADHTLVVANADPLGLLRLINLMTTPAFSRLEPGNVSIVVNKVRPAAVGQDPETKVKEVIDRFTGGAQVHFLPDARAELDAAVLAGRSVTETAPRSGLTRALEDLATALPVVAPAPSRRARRRRERTSRRNPEKVR